MKRSLIKNTKIILLVIVCVFLANHLFVFLGLYGDDDINYARIAAKLAHNGCLNLTSTDHFEHRFLAIIGTAFFYKFFGINVYTTCAFSVVCCVAIGFVLYKLLANQNYKTLLLCFGLFFFNYDIIFHSHRLLADIVIAFFVISNICIYLKINFEVEKNNKHNIVLGFIFSLIFCLAITAKETIYITAPLWIYIFVNDIYKKKNNLFWISAIASFTGLIFCYLLVYKLNTGSWFYRLEILDANNYLNPCSYSDLPKIETIKRVVYLLIDNFILSGYAMMILPAFCCFVYRKKVFENKPKFRLLSICFFVLLLGANFMSLSIKTYFPLCPASRHFLYLIPLATILSSFILIAYFKQPNKYVLFPILFILVDIRMLFSGLGYTKIIYFLLTFLLLVAYIMQQIKIKKIASTFFAFLFLFIFSLKGFNTFLKQPYPFYFEQQKLVTTVINNKEMATVFCNTLETKEIAEFITEFNNKQVDFTELTSTFTTNNLPKNKVFFLLNCSFENTKANLIHQQIIKQLSNNITFVKQGNVYLYSIKNGTDLATINTINNNQIIQSTH